MDFKKTGGRKLTAMIIRIGLLTAVFGLIIWKSSGQVDSTMFAIYAGYLFGEGGSFNAANMIEKKNGHG